MGINTIDSEKLRNYIDSKGLKYGYIAEQLGIKVIQTLQRKIDGVYDFKLSEVIILIDLLGLIWEKDLELIKEIFLSKK